MDGGVDDGEPLPWDADTPADLRERVLQGLVPADEIHADPPVFVHQQARLRPDQHQLLKVGRVHGSFRPVSVRFITAVSLAAYPVWSRRPLTPERATADAA